MIDDLLLSPRSATTTFHHSVPAPNTEAINELLGTMRQTLATLGATFDHLGEQTTRIASLGPALDAQHQVNSQILVRDCLFTHVFSLVIVSQ